MSILFNNGQGYGINPTTGFIPYNSGGTFSDSPFKVWYDNFTNTQVVGVVGVYNGVNTGFLTDPFAKQYILGDFGNTGNGTFILVGDSSRIIRTQSNGYPFGWTTFFKNTITLGDYNLSGNQTFFTIDDINQRIEFSTNLRAATAGVAALQYLKVRVAGTDYKIALLNP